MRTSLIDFIEKSGIYCQQRFGPDGLVVETGEYPEIEELIPPTDAALEADKFGISLLTFKVRLKARQGKLDARQQHKVQIYAVLYGKLSPESKERLKAEVDWEEIHRTKSPRRLRMAIMDTHQTAETGFKLRDKHEARREYYMLVQLTSDSLAQFKKVFDHALKQLKSSVPLEEYPKDADQAIDFIKKLDPERYGVLQRELDNNAAMKIGTYPENLQKAYSTVTQYKLPMASIAIGVPSTAAIFVTAGEPKNEGPPKSNKHNNNKKKKTAKDDRDNQDEEKSESGDGKKLQPCKLCQGDHHMFHCPEVSVAVELLRAKRAGAVAGTEKVSVVIHDDVTPDYVVF